MVYLASLLAICIGASLGAFLRWWLGLAMNSLCPSMPLGTLAANILGGFLIGVVIALVKYHGYMPELLKLGIITGFLGGLTTFSTFSAETVDLIFHREYLWTFVIVISHVAGSIFATLSGVIVTRFFIY